MNISPTVYSEEQLAFKKEEFSILLQATYDIEERILKTFSGTLAVSVTLLGAAAGFLFRPEHINNISVGEAYIALAPLLLILPAFLLMVALRKDSARFAAYIHVFVEETNLGPRWTNSVLAFRRVSLTESLDSIPYSFFSLAIVSGTAFIYAIVHASVSIAPHCIALFAVAASLVHLTKQWKNALNYLSICVGMFQTIRDSDQ